MKVLLPGCFLLFPAAAFAAITGFAEFHLGEAGSLGATYKVPQDSSGLGHHLVSAISRETAQVVTEGVYAPGSTAFISTAGPANEGWYATGLLSSFQTDNFAVGVFARAAAMDGVNRDVITLGDSNGSLKLSLSTAGWAGSANNFAWIGSANGLAGSFTPNQWTHLAMIRHNGVTTFYINGVAQGNAWGGTPVHDNLHLSVNPGGGTYFNGDIDEARIMTFDAATTDQAILTALWGAPELPPPPQEATIAEQSFDTVAGKRYIAAFTLSPGEGLTTIPQVGLEVTGTATLIDQALIPTLPVGGGGAPFRIAFTADSAQNVVKFMRPAGAAAPHPVIGGLQVIEAVEPVPANVPSAVQQAQIDRRYGMFIHFGINTFHNEQWTDGTKPPASYAPTGLDVDQWVRTAREAGMKHIILTAKHHDGFCLWDSPWTTYDVASSPVTTDVVAAAAAACQKYGVGLGIYYSLWDRHEPTYGDDAAYNQYMLRQLAELLGNYGPVCELWLDGGWQKENQRWANSEIYDLAKRLQPGCLVSTNWTVGNATNADQHNITPGSQEEGFLIRYFPNDFRLADPYLPKFPDPKLFAHGGQSYYLPFEATITLSAQSYWFYDTNDTGPKPINTLAGYYYSATAQDNILILNAPPDRSGTIREVDRQGLFQLRDLLGLQAGMPLPKNVNGAATGTASATWQNDLPTYGPQWALDGDPATRWACGPAGTTSASIEVNFGALRSFDRVLIDEYEVGAGVGRIQAFHLEAWNGSTWRSFHSGTSAGRFSLHHFPRQNASKFRLVIDQSTDAPSLWELQAFDSGHAFSVWRDSNFPGASTTADADWDADPDDDGLSNRVEFTLGADPHLRTALPGTHRDGGMIRLDLPWNAEATPGFCEVAYSFDLAQWFNASAPVHPGVEMGPAGAGEKSWVIDPAQNPNWFYRLE